MERRRRAAPQTITRNNKKDLQKSSGVCPWEFSWSIWAPVSKIALTAANWPSYGCNHWNDLNRKWRGAHPFSSDADGSAPAPNNSRINWYLIIHTGQSTGGILFFSFRGGQLGNAVKIIDHCITDLICNQQNHRPKTKNLFQQFWMQFGHQTQDLHYVTKSFLASFGGKSYEYFKQNTIYKMVTQTLPHHSLLMCSSAGRNPSWRKEFKTSSCSLTGFMFCAAILKVTEEVNKRFVKSCRTYYAAQDISVCESIFCFSC